MTPTPANAEPPRRTDLLYLSLGLVGGVLGQIVLGGITVLVDLHPLAVQGHMLVSLVLVANAIVLVHRASQPDDGSARSRLQPILLKWLEMAPSMVVDRKPRSTPTRRNALVNG